VGLENLEALAPCAPLHIPTALLCGAVFVCVGCTTPQQQGEKPMIEQVKSLCEAEAVRVEAMEGLCPLYYHYDGQHSPQGAAIFIKVDPLEVRAAYYGELGGTWDIDDWYGRRFAIPIPPNATKSAIAEYLRDDDTHAMIAEIAACYKEEQRGGEVHGTWDDAPVFEIPVELDTAAVFSTRDYLESFDQDFDPVEREAKVGGYILPLEDDEQLDRVCEEIRKDAEDAPYAAIFSDLTPHTIKKIAREICADWYETEGLPYNILPRGYCTDDCVLVLEPDARSRWVDGVLYVRSEDGAIYAVKK
jgi:hypothetical protein